MILKDMPEFGTHKEKIAWIVSNKEKLIKVAKDTIKHADCLTYSPKVMVPVNKAAGEVKNEISVKIVINTTNLLDSHLDVHLPGIWDKSLSENRYILHLQEHNLSFSNIIADSDELKASAEVISWKDLGFTFEGKTQALIFDSTIKRDRNGFMFEQYRKGYVKQHSVGMRYVRLILAVNDESYGAEYDAWNKYYPEIANKDRADELGYFWAVPEAKIIEGSAVPLGSNWATPTLEVKNAPSEKDTRIPPPSIDTEAAKKIIENAFKKFAI